MFGNELKQRTKVKSRLISVDGFFSSSQSYLRCHLMPKLLIITVILHVSCG